MEKDESGNSEKEKKLQEIYSKVEAFIMRNYSPAATHDMDECLSTLRLYGIVYPMVPDEYGPSLIQQVLENLNYQYIRIGLGFEWMVKHKF